MIEGDEVKGKGGVSERGTEGGREGEGGRGEGRG